MSYYSTILNDIFQRYRLQPQYQVQSQRTRQGLVVHNARVSVNGIHFENTDYDRTKAQEQAARDAIAGLEAQGFDFKTVLNNIASKYKLRVQYENRREGPTDRPTWISGVLINEIPEGNFGRATRQIHAEELAAKTVVEILEARGYLV